MTYSVKEIFYTLQGEGAQAGRPAVFCRFSGCNLWSGRERDRGTSICRFCDTDFIGTDGPGGGKFRQAEALASAIDAQWPGHAARNKYVVLTGGEPLLQVDQALTDALHARGFTIAVETNGTLALPDGIDWVCVSPKSSAELLITRGNELKLVYPQHDAMPDRFEALDFEVFYLQPMDAHGRQQNTLDAIDYCKSHPQWRLGLQQHKILMIP
ncbi:7-carboxy-7-deazaguanine synthase [Stutzerimonas kirkiae]|uniref:7-carboxy-7-deazaguanine synthase n=1 Tax=Stutzerimonas kirkiae TaxID=2211392 RepID=A0A4Q9R789_9GAMM|nr:7-carboxy-7-deazaguanine synthase [Stutzerimonas kirkiae]TBU95538.1 7-carboxy-7-deazaguanine synthase [Stutzerimonas kirkiae]TBV02520.1 7-carboxy-7-deazaguanine synthase [Stutzerimonas kirkiae]TBV09187.1 7-carboxy-7-deazaguanine synthase [Stutzerimonas kirkiae]TBV12166.1 7-carboxy-7-deazaguanine synthase [Stutzerimonas kirkiae]